MILPEEIILNWLNKDLNFTPKVKNISKEFSDGYNFAQILYIIKEITESQLEDFAKDTTDMRSIKNNFSLIKKYFHDKFDLEIRQEEFDEIIEKDKAKAVVILYKLKNAIKFKKINFHNIKSSLYPESKKEINEKVRKIIDYEYFNDLFNKDLLYDTFPKEDNKFNFTSNLKTVTFSDQNIIQTSYSRQFTDNEIAKIPSQEIDYPYSTKMSGYFHTKSTDLISNEDQKKPEVKLPKIFSNLKDSTKYPNYSKNRKKNALLITDVNNQPLPAPKIPVFGDGTTNIAYENKFRISKLTDNLFRLGVNDFQFNFKHTLPVFNSNNIQELDKIRKELRNKIRTIDEEKKQKSYKKDLQIRLYDVPEIDFRGNNGNKKSHKEMKIFSEKKQRRLIPLEKMKKYCKEWFIYSNQRKLEKKIKYFSSLIKNLNKTEEKIINNFSNEKYLSTLDINDIDEINEALAIKIAKKKLNYPIMHKIILLIIDMAMEIFFYQEGKNTDIIDIETYTKFLELFIANKPMRERVDYEARIIKEKNKDDININVDKLKLNSQEQDLKEDYKNYVGFWNSDIIMERKFKGMKIDIKLLRSYLPQDYEPTESEIEDLSLPIFKEDNFFLGDVILELLDNKFQEKNVTHEKGKWDYIDYKLALIGLPFCGKNFIAEEIQKKYPNLKIYSITNILRSYCNEYKTITEPLENNPKFKSMKPNQIEQLKQEKENKLKEFEPKLKLIQPYLDLINEKTNNEQDKDTNQENNDTIIIPSDELLLNILIYNIENDFQKLSEEEQKNEIIKSQTLIMNLMKQKENLEKQIQESKKPNPKDEQNLANLEKEIEKEKNNTVKGFILVDFPTNIKQCNMLEHYLNGYVDITNIPKSPKVKNIEKINNLIDFNFQPTENNKIKKAGIDFIINIITKEELVNNRFTKKKYDPLNDKIYSEYELNQELIMKDKKLQERLEDNIPYYTQEHFDFYKNQYNENISKIDAFYSQFGFSKNSSNESNLNIINFDLNEKDISRTYQEINLEDTKDLNESEEEKLAEEKVEEKGKKNQLNKEQLMMMNKENEIKEKIFNHVNNLIDILFLEKEANNKKLFLKEHPEFDSEEKDIDEEKDKIQFDPDFKINEIRGTNLPKKQKKESNIYSKALNFVNGNFDNVLSDLIKFDNTYEKRIGKFVFLIKKQQNDIYSRLILIQKKYRDFLNLRSDKKKVISLYCQKYNSFFTEYPSAFNSVLAINDFNEDIDKLNNALWSLINLKETVSIKELQEIKNSNFIEHELKKFYKFIKDLFLLETEKFLNMINSIFELYKMKNPEISNKNLNNIKNNSSSKDKNKKDNKKDNKKSKIKTKVINEKEHIFIDLIDIPDNYAEDNDNDDDITDVNPQNRRFFFKSKKPQYDLDYLINKNVEIIFDNCLNLILSQQEKIDSTLKSLKDSFNPTFKKTTKFKKKQTESLGSSVMSTFMQTKEGLTSIDENVKRMFDKEKSKYKYRLCFIRSFVTRYIIIINQTSKKVFRNIDNWIINSVSLQSEARKRVINKLKSLLKEKKLIDEEKDINHIELDTFESLEENKRKEKENENKIYEKLNVEYLISDDFVNIIIKEEKDPEQDKKSKKNKYVQKNYKIIVPKEYENDSIVDANKKIKLSDKLYEIDFVYNIWKLYDLYNKLILLETKKNVMSQNIFYENFIKKFIFIKDHKDSIELSNDSFNQYASSEINKNNFQSNKVVIQNFNKDKLNINKFPIICNALKTLTYKNIKKLFSLFQISVEHPMGEKEKPKNEEYDKYINPAKIFTILALIGCEVLTEQKENNIMKDFKFKLVKNKFVPKNEFMRYKFWFENNFRATDNNSLLKNKKNSIASTSKSSKKLMRQKTKNFTNSPYALERKNKEEEQRNFSIKDLLYYIWLDKKENMINFREFIDVLKVCNYTTKIENEKEIYFDVIFDE